MKKRILSLVLALTVVGGFAFQPQTVKAYKGPTIEEGQRWETESNNTEADATLLLSTTSGQISDVEDMDYYVYTSTTTKESTLKLLCRSNLGLPDAKIHFYVAERVNGEYTLIHDGEVSTSGATGVSFNAVKGHGYIIMVGFNGGTQEIQDKIDYLKEKTGKGFAYTLIIS